MYKFQLQMPARASYLAPADMGMVFRLLDKDGSGRLNGGEVQDMFNQICGRDVQVNGAMESYTLKQFTRVVEDTDARYPQFKVGSNLMNYLKENQGSLGGAMEPLSIDNCQKLFQIMDADGTGELDVNEMIKMFFYMGVTGIWWMAAFREFGTLTSPEETQACLQTLNGRFPQLDIDDKVVAFLAQAAEVGGKPDVASAEEVPEAEPDEVGTKKALLVGINYIGSANELGGCINDVRNQYRVLVEKFGFEEENIMLLTEDQDDDDKRPTKAKIQEGFDWLMNDASPGDELFFQYSGHGSQMPDRSGSEKDGKNECICPVDCMDGPWPDMVILDNEIYSVFYERLPDGVKCICVFDCCHSGTIADLQCTRELKFDEPTEHTDQKSRFLDPPGDLADELSGIVSQERSVVDRDCDMRNKQLWTFSGCQDNQTSADATIGGIRQGALTWGFTKALEECGWRASYMELLNATRANLKGKYTQIPGLSTTNEEYYNHFYLETKGE